MTNITNSISKSRIMGDVVYGDKITYIFHFGDEKNPFYTQIFLHYIGDKVSKSLLPKNKRIDCVRKTNKLALTLFNNVYISLSDLLQSPFIYDEFFRNVLRLNPPIFTIIGTSKNGDFDKFFEKRDKLYFKTGFYQTISEKDEDIKTGIIGFDSVQPKIFETKSYISNAWKTNLESSYDKIDSIQNRYLKSAILQINNQKTISNLIDIPNRLDGMPFIWDSIRYLSLVPENFQGMIQTNFESFLATEWIKCYIENSSSKIFNSILGCNDSTFGIEDCFDLRSVIKFLNKYNILKYILELSFDEFVDFKKSVYIDELQKQIWYYLIGIPTNSKIFNSLEKLNKNCNSKVSCFEKLKNAIYILKEWGNK